MEIVGTSIEDEVKAIDSACVAKRIRLPSSSASSSSSSSSCSSSSAPPEKSAEDEGEAVAKKSAEGGGEAPTKKSSEAMSEAAEQIGCPSWIGAGAKPCASSTFLSHLPGIPWPVVSLFHVLLRLETKGCGPVGTE